MESEWIKCPLCGWHWKRVHTGTHRIEHKKPLKIKGEFSFEKGNLEEDAFISIREIIGGRSNPNNFKEIARITLKDAKDLPEYENLIKSLKSKIQKILKILS